MDTSPTLRTALLALSFVCASARAEWRCDCTTILDSCGATVTVEDNGVSIESDHQCARVDYLVDGLPFVALVVEGRERQSWLSRNDHPEVRMQSCQVCLDNANAPALPAAPASTAAPVLTAEPGPPAAVPAASGGLPAASEPSRLLAVRPQYPPSAASRGLGGFVELSFTVTALGRVEDATVTAAEPPGVFDEAALAAIARWRYSTDERREAVTLSHRFDFKPADAVVARPARRASAETAIDGLIARAAARRDEENPELVTSVSESVDRNYCVREQVSYDYGEMVEVDLMNACSEPLIVFSCAEGVGRYLHRWVCQSTEKSQSILVRPGDRLVGDTAMIDIPEGMRTFTYAENLFVARPPRTEYWWLACTIDDGDCRGSGRTWVRSMNLKGVSIDPQLWTQQSVARSY